MTDRNPGVLIFLAKNWLGMTDRQGIDHSGNILVRYVSRVPGEKPVKGEKGRPRGTGPADPQPPGGPAESSGVTAEDPGGQLARQEKKQT
jgi:hypothetical protein